VKIWKTQLLKTDYQGIAVPFGAKFLTAQLQAGEWCIWYLCNDQQPMTSRKIVVVGTGHETPSGVLDYIDTIQDGAYVFHLFEAV
jgi:hypothetical protein